MLQQENDSVHAFKDKFSHRGKGKKMCSLAILICYCTNGDRKNVKDEGNVIRAS